MKIFYKLVTLLMICGLFTACSSSDDDDDVSAKITISKSDYTVGAEQDSEAVATFSINVGWETSAISYVGDTKDWLTVTPNGKAGTDQTITMKAAANPAGIERKASFNINYGGKQEKLTITQLAKSIDPTITISTSEFTVDGEADSEVVATFSVNVDWETSVISYVGDAKDWLTIAPIEGKAGTDQTITMKAAENPTEIDRKASFDIIYGGKEHKLTVTQVVKKDVDITAHFDVKFAAKLQEEGYIPDATKILFSEVRNITTVNIGETMVLGEITSLAGIEYFEALTELNFDANQVTSVDLSKNIALEILNCNMNKFAMLDLSKNTALTYLNCSNNNQNAFLDVSNSANLSKLYLGKNKLENLDVSKNIALEELFCESNKLTVLDVSKNTALQNLSCSSNQLTTLDVSKNTKLTSLTCFTNKLQTLVVNTTLEIVNCFGNQITTLDLSNCTKLKSVLCFGNQLSSLDLTKSTALSGLSCGNNKLSSLDISKNIALDHLSCSVNELETLDVSKNVNLTQLFCYTNKLTTLDVSKNPNLTDLVCNNNQLKALDVSKNTSLNDLTCNNNQLISLDISKNEIFLKKLACNNNPGATNTFAVKAWFDNSKIPYNFTIGSWAFNEATITVDYQKAM